MKNTYWIWYPGDFEIYHGMAQNIEREERGFGWPAYWHFSEIRKNLRFYRNLALTESTTIVVTSYSVGYVEVDNQKYPFECEIVLAPGEHAIVIYAALLDGVPAIYVAGNVVYSDSRWQVDDFVTPAVPVGSNEKYCLAQQNPSVWEYAKRTVYPIQSEFRQGGLLFTFSTEIVGELELEFTKEFFPLQICYGESELEAMDVKRCYFSQTVRDTTEVIPKRAFRYIYLPAVFPGEVSLRAVEIFEDIEIKADFRCEDEEINRIWEVAVRTFQLCSGIFFIDGIKRDRWIWSGDAYQSYFVNQYLMFDEDINKRTIWALRGNDPVRQHINTILDYSMYWVISIYEHYFMTEDREFVVAILPKVMSMMEYLELQLDERGFITGRANDWTFIDWADIDKTGAVCAEQILLARCYESVSALQEAVGEKAVAAYYQAKYQQLRQRIDEFYWDDSQQAYIDSFSSGKKHVSRQSNIFAVLFGIANRNRWIEIYQNVIQNKNIAAITTPYFKFYELEMLCKLGKKKQVKQMIRDYWGGMLKLGAVTFWEEYDPAKEGEEHYEMYGDPFGKSLCHAWAASPIYFIGKYFIGIAPLKIAYEEFVVEPDVSLFEKFTGVFPVKGGKVWVRWKEGQLEVKTDRVGGRLRYRNQEIELKPGVVTVMI